MLYFSIFVHEHSEALIILLVFEEVLFVFMSVSDVIRVATSHLEFDIRHIIINPNIFQ